LAQAQVLVPEAHSELLQGKGHQTLTQAATRLGADLIVVGRHRYGGITGARPGETMQKLIGHADCAVLVAAGRP
jgi:nucleotide-binding universal stress UspA family protein